MDLKFWKKKEPSMADVEVERVIAHLATLSPDSEEYFAAVNNLVSLQESRSYKNVDSISREAKWLIAARVFQFVAMMLWEGSHMLPKNAISNWLIKIKL